MIVNFFDGFLKLSIGIVMLSATVGFKDKNERFLKTDQRKNRVV